MAEKTREGYKQLLEEQLPFSGSTITILSNSSAEGGGASTRVSQQILRNKLRITQNQVGEGKPVDYQGVNQQTQIIEL